jgi:hypothetical protein
MKDSLGREPRWNADSARGMMPKAARARVASPPADTALARAIRDCLPGRVRLGRDSKVYVA